MRWGGLVGGLGLAALLAWPALADQAGAPPAAAPLTVTPPSPDVAARRMARRAARVDRDIQTLHAGLALSPPQEALWSPLAEAIRGVDAARGFRYRQTLAAAQSANDGLKLQGDHMAAMGAALSRLAVAAKPLVASLSADQKSKLPTLLRDVRLPKALPRALDVPQDTGGATWGIGDQGGADASPARAPAAQPAAGPPSPAPAPGGAKPDADDDED